MMEQEKPVALKMFVLSALFAACIAGGSYIIIPLGPVPFVLSNFFVILAALFLGSNWGTVSVGIYLLCGIIGLPVFSRGGAGIVHLLGPTGGYLFGYLPAVWVGGFISEQGKYSLIKSTSAAVATVLIIYACGVPWLKIQGNMAWTNALITGMLPFLIIDGVKIAAAVAVQKVLLPVVNHFIKVQYDPGKESE
jgi:biotin transport system substrate-specific component